MINTSEPHCWIEGHVPVASESRSCFGLAWFAAENEADAYGAAVREAGHTVNGGFLDGMPCGRASEFDFEMGGRRVFAVRHA